MRTVSIFILLLLTFSLSADPGIIPGSNLNLGYPNDNLDEDINIMKEQWRQAGLVNQPRALPEPDFELVIDSVFVTTHSFVDSQGDSLCFFFDEIGDCAPYINFLLSKLHDPSVFFPPVLDESMVKLTLPSGRFRIRSELIPSNRTILSGSGSDCTEIVLKSRDEYGGSLAENGIELVDRSYVGLEDFKISRDDDFTETEEFNATFHHDEGYNFYVPFGQGMNIYMNDSDNCWVIGVESATPLRHHISISYCDNIEIRGNYIHDTRHKCGGGWGYGVVIEYESNGCLVEDNIFVNHRHAMAVQREARYNVFGYNYSSGQHHPGTSWPTYYPEMISDICIHGLDDSDGGTALGPEKNLFEGNDSKYINVDEAHGRNGMWNTFLRNTAVDYGLRIEHNQEPQIMIWNYGKCTDWWLCNSEDISGSLGFSVQGIPMVNLSSSHDHILIIKKKFVDFWGCTHTRYKNRCGQVGGEWPYYLEGRPVFIGDENMPWIFPRVPSDTGIPAKTRYLHGMKPTVSRGDEGFLSVMNLYGHYDTDKVIGPWERANILPGTTLTFAPGKRLIVKGQLIAEGTEQAPITITCSIPNSTWGGIEFWNETGMERSNIESVLNWCNIEKASGTGMDSGGGLLVREQEGLVVANCRFSECTAPRGAGIHLVNSPITIANSTFEDCVATVAGSAIYAVSGIRSALITPT